MVEQDSGSLKDIVETLECRKSVHRIRPPHNAHHSRITQIKNQLIACKANKSRENLRRHGIQNDTNKAGACRFNCFNRF